MSVIEKALFNYFKKYPLAPKTTIGVAVSGGADSLCLACHLTAYAKKNHLILKAVTVDHGLRPESKVEAKSVHTLLTSWGIEHTTLLWKGLKPKTHIEETARKKRYELIQNWAEKNRIQHLFLAHHSGDQAETFWIRLAHGSGADGLSAMSDHTKSNNLILCRPFLGLSKTVLENDLKKKHITWFCDSMNEDESYERVRWRKRQNELSKWGLTPDLLGRMTSRFARIKHALDFYTNRFVSALVDLSPKGFATIQEQAFLSLPTEIRLRVLKKSIEIIAGDQKSVPLESLERWVTSFPTRSTFGGCVIIRQKGLLFIAREAVRMEPSKDIPPQKLISWDRFTVMASCPIQIRAGSSDKELPLPVRKSIPEIYSVRPLQTVFTTDTKKELEKKFAFEYKKDQRFVFISFEGKNED